MVFRVFRGFADLDMRRLRYSGKRKSLGCVCLFGIFRMGRAPARAFWRLKQTGWWVVRGVWCGVGLRVLLLVPLCWFGCLFVFCLFVSFFLSFFLYLFVFVCMYACLFVSLFVCFLRVWSFVGLVTCWFAQFLCT